MHVILILLVLVTSCSPKSEEQFLARGRVLQQELIQTLESIDDIDACVLACPYLQDLFNQIADQAIEARRWQMKKKRSWQPSEEDRRLSAELAEQFARLYRIPTARLLIEKCQEAALEKLDAFEKKSARKNR